ncbi:MAG: tryptophan 2,3-dioxygenase [Bacteroidetes bacterium]|nr:tryptophan 2,3-dioxygenase [Bacteroidota bacterium]
MELSEDILSRVKQLQDKYAAMGQDLVSYLDGLLHADYLTYWDYIHLDTLLSLQSPRTSFPDEEIFIMYHQITELYFKLSLHELKQVCLSPTDDVAFVTSRVKRVNRYFRNLTLSFEVMVDGMDPAQFLKFRMSLLPASGFQSAQYRMVEIYATDFIHLVDKDHRDKFSKSDRNIRDQFSYIYWKAGATELATGKKTLTLQQFEAKYSDELISLAESLQGRTLATKYTEFEAAGKDVSELKAALRELDVHVNVNWPLSHYKSAVRYLQKDPEDIRATGGTNWQKYLPPRFQKRIFYPELWTEEELTEWGKAWVLETLSKM